MLVISIIIVYFIQLRISLSKFVNRNDSGLFVGGCEGRVVFFGLFVRSFVD